MAQESPQTAILAQDEATLYLQATLRAVWASRGQTPVIGVHPGREKVNFYGALNLRTGQEIAMQAPAMTSDSAAQHLKQVLDTVPDVPILLLWDHAPWHYGPSVREVVEANPRLEVMYFPVAAPDLNPQEQVWKATRHAVSHNHLGRRLPDLAVRFEDHPSTTTFESSFLDRYGFNAIYPMFK